jgi:hypothetical protein
MTVVKSMASAAEGAGVSAAEASKLAFAGMYEYVDDNSSAAIDFTATATMNLIRADVETAFDAFADTAAGVALGLNTAAKKAEFSVVATAAQVEVQEVATAIASLAVGDSDADRAATFKVISVLAETIETYSKDVSDNGASGATALTFNTTAQVANTAPTDITLAGSTTTDTTYSATSAESIAFLETAPSLVVGSLTGVDAETATGSLTFAIAGGTDAAYFEITGGNVLAFKAQPDYESGKTSYSVAVSVEDALGMKKVETFTVSITDDTTEGGAFQINDNLVTWTDYNPSSATAGTDITSTVMTTTTDSTKTVDMGGTVYLNHTNLTYLFDAESAGTTGKTPTLKFKLSDVPTGVGSATITAGIVDHLGVAGTEGVRVAGESAISITMKVDYSGNGTTATLTVPAQADASGSYTKADGTQGTFTLANVDADSFAITENVAANGVDVYNTLDVKISALYDAFIAGAGTSDMLKVGSYAVKIESTLPLADAPADGTDSAAEVTTFQGIVELVASTPKDSITGTSGADSITIASTGGMVNGMGGADTITLGSGTDYVILSSALGTQTKANAATVTNFTDATDKFALDGLTTSQLTVAEGTTSADSVISIKASETASGYEEFLMHVTGVATSALSPLGTDYMLVADIA